MAKKMEKKFEKITEFIEEGDKDGMLNYIKKHKIKPKDFSEDFGTYYPIDCAATYGQCDIFNALVELGYKVEGVEIHPIFQACNDGCLDLVQVLVEVHGVNPSTPDPYGSTAMTCAVSDGYMDVVKYLISAGVSVHQRISDYEFEDITILHYAAVSKSCPEICEYLISVGADIEAKDAEGNTPLHKAAQNSNEDVIVVLLDAGAIIDARNSAGETPFLAAAKAFNENTYHGNGGLKMLYKRGADPVAKDSSGKTALHYAMNSYKQAYFLLVEVNLTPSSPNDVKELFNLALTAECTHTINLLLNLGYDPSHIDDIHHKIESWKKSEKGQEVMKNLQEISTTPRGLADLCCFKIRRFLGTSLSKVLDTLPVTEKVKEFLRLSHIPDKMEDEDEWETEDEDEDGEEEEEEDEEGNE